MRTCKTCKSWTRQEDDHVGDCNCPLFVYQPWISIMESKTPRNGLAYWDQESYQADFETGEDFGCIHWEKQDDAGQ